MYTTNTPQKRTAATVSPSPLSDSPVSRPARFRLVDRANPPSMDRMMAAPLVQSSRSASRKKARIGTTTMVIWLSAVLLLAEVNCRPANCRMEPAQLLTPRMKSILLLPSTEASLRRRMKKGNRTRKAKP